MSFYLKPKQREHLALLSERSADDVIELCKCAFDYLQHGENNERFELLSHKYNCNTKSVKQLIEALISLLIDATKANANDQQITQLQEQLPLQTEIFDILAQFVSSKRAFVEGSIKSANIRAYRLINLEWRLEVRFASRSLHEQCNIFITMKLYLHTEPKNENRDLLNSVADSNQDIHPDERRNRKNMLVQTDINSLLYMIRTLEDALSESRSRRIKNIVKALE